MSPLSAMYEVWWWSLWSWVEQVSKSLRLPPYRQTGYEQGPISVIAQVAGGNDTSATATEVEVTSL
jgi:hypothetical protein